MNVFYRGEATDLIVTVTDGVPTTELPDGTPVDIETGPYRVTGLEYVLKASLDDADQVLIAKDLVAGIIVRDQVVSIGQAKIVIATADTKPIPAGDYWEMVTAVFAAAPGQAVYVIRPRRRYVRGVPKLPA
ncbi:MAG: hypothetical protein QOI20_3274 [Acidimicrobiaceae bacterium]|jgi:hypothetical protein|nr:hypothetical protein [Acidimicrobiaceae bacterium]